MDACSLCPHANDCLKVGACLDDLNAPLIASGQFPRRMTPKQANEFMAALRAGRTLKRISGGGKKLGPAIASPKKFHTHCGLYPEWGAEAKRLAAANAKAADALKSPKRYRRLCKHGHSLDIGRVYFRYGYECRRCPACDKIRNAKGGVIKPDVLAQVQELVKKKAPIRSFAGSGAGSGYVLSYPTLLKIRREYPGIDQMLSENIKTANSRGQKLRWLRVKNEMIREQNNDYYKIRAMLPANFPGKDDVVSAIFEDLLTGRLQAENVRACVPDYVVAYNRMYPTKYAKFGDSPLVSLDEVLFDDGTMTRGDTVTRGLWG